QAQAKVNLVAVVLHTATQLGKASQQLQVSSAYGQRREQVGRMGRLRQRGSCGGRKCRGARGQAGGMRGGRQADKNLGIGNVAGVRDGRRVEGGEGGVARVSLGGRGGCEEGWQAEFHVFVAARARLGDVWRGRNDGSKDGFMAAVCFWRWGG